MSNNLPDEGLETRSEIHSPRRRLLQTAFALTAVGGLQSLAAGDAFAADSAASAAAKSPLARRSRVASPMQDAIKACLDCHSMCLRMAMGYCLERGGRHAEQKHLRLMINCAELCQTSANFMLSDSPLHSRVCLICAEACEACAKSCEQVGDMRDCVEECQACAKSCRTMT